MTTPPQPHQSESPRNGIEEKQQLILRVYGALGAAAHHISAFGGDPRIAKLCQDAFDAITEAQEGGAFCGLCGGYGAANGVTHEPVECMACGRKAEGMILTALHLEPEERGQVVGLRLIEGGDHE